MSMQTLDSVEEQDNAARDSSSTAGQLSSVRGAAVPAGTLVGTAGQLHARQRSLGSEADDAGKAAAATAVLQRTPDDFEDLSLDGEGPEDAHGPWWEDFVQVMSRTGNQFL